MDNRTPEYSRGREVCEVQAFSRSLASHFARSRTRVLLLCSERLPVAWESRDDGLTEEKSRLQDDTSYAGYTLKDFQNHI